MENIICFRMRVVHSFPASMFFSLLIFYGILLPQLMTRSGINFMLYIVCQMIVQYKGRGKCFAMNVDNLQLLVSGCNGLLVMVFLPNQ